MLYTGRNYKFDLIDLDASGNPVPNNQLKVEVYKLEWRWWWDNSESTSSADFVSTYYNHLADSLTVSVSHGKSEFPMQVTDDDWGRYLIKVTDKRSGHITGQIVYFDWYGYNRAPGGEKQAAAMLTFTADKPKYKIGDKVKLTVPSSEGGRILVCVENSSSVLKSFWVDTRKGSTECSFEVTGNMAPNCYASVSLLQPHSQTKNDLPIRLYGVIPILVEDLPVHLLGLELDVEVRRVLGRTVDDDFGLLKELGKLRVAGLAVGALADVGFVEVHHRSAVRRRRSRRSGLMCRTAERNADTVRRRSLG